LAARAKGAYSGKSEYFDAAIQAGTIAVDSDAYSTALDFIYDVKGLKDLYILIKNTGVTNGLTYKVQQARKEFALLTDLVDADFVDGLVAEANVAQSAEAESDITRANGEITAIRLRVKRQTSALDTTLGGQIVVNA